MRKENRVVVTYVNSLIKGLQDIKQKLTKCEPDEIKDLFNEFMLKIDSKDADRVETFLYSLEKKYNANK